MFDFTPWMEDAMKDAERIIDLVCAADGARCTRLHRNMTRLLNRSRTSLADQVLVLTTFLGSVIDHVDPPDREKLAGDIPFLIDLARDRLAQADGSGADGTGADGAGG
jgi:hypothetical protein